MRLLCYELKFHFCFHFSADYLFLVELIKVHLESRLNFPDPAEIEFDFLAFVVAAVVE